MKYKVKKGDTLWNIWKKYYKTSYTWQEFQTKFSELNEGKDPSLLKAGEMINLPDPKGFTGFFIRLGVENPALLSIGSFALGGIFIIGVLYLTKKLKL